MKRDDNSRFSDRLSIEAEVPDEEVHKVRIEGLNVGITKETDGDEHSQS
jgi:hypothetical protein